MSDGLMTSSPFQSGGDPRRGGAGPGTWQYRRPAEVPATTAPAATPAPATPAPEAADLLERMAAGERIGDGDAAAFEQELNAAIAVAGGQGGQRPAPVAPGDLGELAGKMQAARQHLAPGGRRSGVVGAAGADAPSVSDLEGMEAQLAALIRQDPRAREAAPEKGSLAARVRELEQRAQGELDPAELHQLDREIEAAEQQLNDEVGEHAAGRDQFETYAPRPVEVDEELLERARSNSRSLTAVEADQFEAMLNQQVETLGRNPELTRAALPEAAPAGPAGPAAFDPLAGVSSEVVLAALGKLGVSEERIAAAFAGEHSDEGAGA